MIEIRSPLAASVVAVLVEVGRNVRAGGVVAIVESMKMEHEIRAETGGTVSRVRAAAGETVGEGYVLVVLEATAAHGLAGDSAPAPTAKSSDVRPDLVELRERERRLVDASRPEAVAKRHALGLRTARENIADLCDAGSFIEYGAFAIAAQRSRRSLDDLVRNTPADGMVTGIGSIDGAIYGVDLSRTVVMAYDATVLAGTQGMRNHQKTDRLLAIAAEQRLPVVLFAEGGGGRPGDVDMPIVAGLHVTTFASFARLSGLVPLVGIAAGRCFAGNAALLGCCDVIVATKGSSIGMGGPAMVEGGGLGRFRPEEIGPSSVQSRSGVIDVLVEDEREAVLAARRYLGLVRGGRTQGWCAGEPSLLRELLPESRLRVYDMRAIVAAIEMAHQGQLAVDLLLLQEVLRPARIDDPLWMLKFLTEREWEVMRCIMDGLGTEQIAGQLSVKRSTARTHVQNLLTKLGVHSRLQAAALMATHASAETWPVHMR